MTTTALAPAQPAASETSEEKKDRLVIVVAERHIRYGERGSSWRCPVALALTEVGYQGVQVCADHFHVDNGRRYEAPDSLAQWIEDFDAGRAVHPERWVIRSAAAV